MWNLGNACDQMKFVCEPMINVCYRNNVYMRCFGQHWNFLFTRLCTTLLISLWCCMTFLLRKLALPIAHLTQGLFKSSADICLSLRKCFMDLSTTAFCLNQLHCMLIIMEICVTTSVSLIPNKQNIRLEAYALVPFFLSYLVLSAFFFHILGYRPFA